MAEAEDLDTIFTHHPPTPGQVQKHEDLRAAGRVFAQILVELCPDSDERKSAIDFVDLAVMKGNAAIARR